MRLFDRRPRPLPKTLNSYKIPNVEHLSGEWQIYIDTAANGELAQDRTEYWRAMQEQLPQSAALPQSYIAPPVSSSDVERSFSKYGTVLSPFCQCMLTDSLRAHCSLLSILQQHCTVKTIGVTVVLSVDCVEGWLCIVHA